MTVPVRRIRSAVFPILLDDAWPRLLVCALFWVSTALLATVLLVAEPVFGSFVVGIPLLFVVLVRERGLEGVPAILFGAAIGSSLVFTIFLGQQRGFFADGVLIAGFVTFVVWASTYPVMLAQMNRQYLRERRSVAAGQPTESPHSPARLHLVRAWMVLLAVAVVAVGLVRALPGA